MPISLRPERGGIAPSAAALSLLALDRAPGTWNRYAEALRAWEAYAARVGTSFLPAEAGHFANFRAATTARGYAQTKQRACAIAAFRELARCPSPSVDTSVIEVCGGVRRSRCHRRGGARPVFTTEIPAADALPSPPRRSGRGRGSAWPRSVEKRGRHQAARAAAILGDAGLRFDCLHESQLGDVIIHLDLTDLSVFGSKTDHTLQGQPAVLPASNRTNSGTLTLVEGTTEGLCISPLRPFAP